MAVFPIAWPDSSRGELCCASSGAASPCRESSPARAHVDGAITEEDPARHDQDRDRRAEGPGLFLTDDRGALADQVDLAGVEPGDRGDHHEQAEHEDERGECRGVSDLMTVLLQSGI